MKLRISAKARQLGHDALLFQPLARGSAKATRDAPFDDVGFVQFCFDGDCLESAAAPPPSNLKVSIGSKVDGRPEAHEDQPTQRRIDAGEGGRIVAPASAPCSKSKTASSASRPRRTTRLRNQGTKAPYADG